MLCSNLRTRGPRQALIAVALALGLARTAVPQSALPLSPPPTTLRESAPDTLPPVRIWWPLAPVERLAPGEARVGPAAHPHGLVAARPPAAGMPVAGRAPGAVTGVGEEVVGAEATPTGAEAEPTEQAAKVEAPVEPERPPAPSSPGPERLEKPETEQRAPAAMTGRPTAEIPAMAAGSAPPPSTVLKQPPKDDRVTVGGLKVDRPKEDETELTFETPSGLALPRVASTLPESGLAPPTAAVRRWTFAAPEGGLTWESKESTKEGDLIVLRGQVDIRAGIERIQADEVRLQQSTLKLEAIGNVVLDRLDARLTGESLEYDVNTNTGVMHEAFGFTGEDLSFTAKVAEKVGAEKYLLRDATFTSCTQPGPFWQVKATKAIVHIDRFVYLWNPRIVFGKVPAFYLPWMAIPIREKRSTGFMVPRIGNSSVRGFHAQEEFFWAINRQADMTLGGMYWSKYGWRGDAEARWFLEGMPDYGYVKGAFLHRNEGQDIETALGNDRYDVAWEHRQTFGEWDFTATGEIASDQFLDFDKPGDEGIGDLTPIFNQRFTLQRSWGKHSLNLTAENNQREDILTSKLVADAIPPDFQHLDYEMPSVQSGNPPELPSSLGSKKDIDRKLPLAEYRTSGLQLGGRKWLSLSMEGSLAHLQKIQEVEYNYDYSGTPNNLRIHFADTLMSHTYDRVDFYPQLRLPVGTSWLQIIPEIAVRGTWWSKKEFDPRLRNSLDSQVNLPAPASDPDPDPTPAYIQAAYVDTDDEGIFLWGWDAGLTFEGPDFSRIYNLDALPGQRKWQHLIEPSIELNYAPEMGFEPLILGDQMASHYSSRFDRDANTETQPGAPRKGTTDRATIRLVNTLRNKVVSEPGAEQEQARDWLIWTLSTDYDFVKPAIPDTQIGDRTERSWWNNVQSDVNFKPTDEVHFALRNTYDVIQDDITSTTLTGGLAGRWGYIDISLNSTRERGTLDATNTDLALTGEHWFYKNDRLRIGYDLSRKLDEKNRPPGASPWLYKRLILSYYNQCIGFSLSWEDQNLSRGSSSSSSNALPPEKEWIFTVSLKDLGNYLRYKKSLRR